LSHTISDECILNCWQWNSEEFLVLHTAFVNLSYWSKAVTQLGFILTYNLLQRSAKSHLRFK